MEDYTIINYTKNYEEEMKELTRMLKSYGYHVKEKTRYRGAIKENVIIRIYL